MSNLRVLRRACGLTQIQLAQGANVSRFRLCMAESGSLKLLPGEMEAIWNAMRPAIGKMIEIASEFQRNLSEVEGQ